MLEGIDRDAWRLHLLANGEGERKVMRTLESEALKWWLLIITVGCFHLSQTSGNVIWGKTGDETDRKGSE